MKKNGSGGNKPINCLQMRRPNIGQLNHEHWNRKVKERFVKSTVNKLWTLIKHSNGISCYINCICKPNVYMKLWNKHQNPVIKNVMETLFH